MMWKVFATMLLGVSAALHQQDQSSSNLSSSEDAAGRAALEQVCGTCHEPDLGAGAFRTPTEWDEVLTRMIDKGATGTDQQFALVATYLLRNYGKVNVNKAKPHDLAAVLNVTPEIAHTIVSHRQEHGGFKSLEDLKKIPGVNAKDLEARKDRLMF